MRILYLLTLVNIATSVKIGVSKPDATTTTTSTITTFTTTTTNSPSTTTTLESTITQEFIEDSTLLDLGDESNDTTTPIATIFASPTTTSTAKSTPDSLTTPNFPPKITRKPKRKTSSPTSTTTTTTTTTTKPKLTTTLVPILDEEPEDNEILNNISKPLKENKSSGFQCLCDLLENICDINCCCDKYCTKAALQVFNCFVESLHPELRTRLEDFQYQHGLPSCKINDGWLCVFRSNVKPENNEISLQHNLYNSNFYKWSNPLMTTDDDTSSQINRFYKYNEPIKIYDTETQLIKNFELPFAFKPPYCLIKDPIRHLKTLRRTCLSPTLKDAQNIKQNLFELMTSHYLLSSPEIKEEDFSKDLIIIEIQICHEDKNCANLFAGQQNNSANIESKHTYAKEIFIGFTHNFTNLLNVLIVMNEKTVHDDVRQEYWQTLIVEFSLDTFKEQFKTKFNDMKIDEKAISGPLGYLVGEPIIITKFSVINNSAESMNHNNKIAEYFHENAKQLRIQHSIKTFSSQNGECIISSEKDNFINYGINTIKQCKMKFNQAVQSTNNFTEICMKLQANAFEYLLNDLQKIEDITEYYVSEFGKPQNQSKHWLQFNLKSFEDIPIRGEYEKHTKSFTCHNFLQNVGFEFQVGSYTVQTVPRQNLIKMITVNVGERLDLEFNLDETIEMPLILTVRFYNPPMDTISGGKQVKNYKIVVLILIIIIL